MKYHATPFRSSPTFWTVPYRRERALLAAGTFVLRLKVDTLFGDAKVSFLTPLMNPCRGEKFPMHPNCPFLRTMKSLQLVACVLVDAKIMIELFNSR